MKFCVDDIINSNNEYLKEQIKDKITKVRRKYKYIDKIDVYINDSLDVLKLQLKNNKIEYIEQDKLGYMFKSIINDLIIKKVRNNDIEIIDNYITNYLNEEQYDNIFRELNAFFNNYRYSPELDDLIEIISNSKVLNKIIYGIYEKKSEIINKYGIEQVISDEKSKEIWDAFFIVNNINFISDESIEELKREIEQKRNDNLSDDTLKDFLANIKSRLMSKDEQYELIRRAQNGDKSAKDILVENNIPLVVSVAKKYFGYSYTLMDIIQEGIIGLMKAIERFDLSKGYHFSTYAIYWIRCKINRSIVNNDRIVRLPAHLHEKCMAFRKKYNELADRLGKEPTIDEISNYIQMEQDEIMEMMKSLQQIKSLDDKVKADDDDDSRLLEFIADDYDLQNDVEEKISKQELKEFLINSSLSEREVEVLFYRNGFFNGRIYTLQEIADIYNVTRERIRQIEDKALRKIRNSIKLGSIIDYSSDPSKIKNKIKMYKGKVYRNTDFLGGVKQRDKK